MDSNNAPYPPPPYTYRQKSSDHAAYLHANSEYPGSRQWGPPVMGAPANPSSHPDNQQAATAGFQGSNSGSSLFRQPSGSFEEKQGQTRSIPTTSGTVPLGQAPQRPYVQASTTPGQNGTTIGKVVEQVNQFGKKAGNCWGHLVTGNSVTGAAWGRLSAGTKVLREGGSGEVFRSTFQVDADEVLRKTYACYLSTSTDPVAGTLYVSSKKFAFCSDRRLSYTSPQGQQADSFYKVVVPLDRVREVNPSVNQNKPAEKYIQVNTLDNDELWFMGFVNYDKGVVNMQAAVRDRGTTPSTQTAGPNHAYPPPPAH